MVRHRTANATVAFSRAREGITTLLVGHDKCRNSAQSPPNAAERSSGVRVLPRNARNRVWIASTPDRELFLRGHGTTPVADSGIRISGTQVLLNSSTNSFSKRPGVWGVACNGSVIEVRKAGKRIVTPSTVNTAGSAWAVAKATPASSISEDGPSYVTVTSQTPEPPMTTVPKAQLGGVSVTRVGALHRPSLHPAASQAFPQPPQLPGSNLKSVHSSPQRPHPHDPSQAPSPPGH